MSAPRSRREVLAGAVGASGATLLGLYSCRTLGRSGTAAAPLPRPRFYWGTGIENTWIAQSYFGLPIHLMETSAGLTDAAKVAYIEALHEMVVELRREGFPIVGVNWWPLFDTIQWDYREHPEKPIADFIYPGGWNYGLWRIEAGDGDLKRIPTAAVGAFRDMVRSDRA